MSPLICSIIKQGILKFSKRQNIRLISNVQNYLIDTNHKDNPEHKNFLVQKFTEINNWYSQVTGLDEVKKLQNRVIVLHEKLEKTQEERRNVGRILTEIRKKSSELQDQLYNMNKYENTEKFVNLTKQEVEVLKEEKHLTAKFEILDKTEREYFTALSNAVRDSHEKERMQSEYTKYWGIILSIIGTIFGAIVSTIISSIRNNQIVHKINTDMENNINQILKSISVDDKLPNRTLESLLLQITAETNKSSETLFKNLVQNQHQLQFLIENKFQEIKTMLHRTNNQNVPQTVIQTNSQLDESQTIAVGALGFAVAIILLSCCCAGAR